MTGRLVEPGDVAGFADAVQAYVRDVALREAHGRAGEMRSRDYSWDAINAAVASAYVRLLSERGGAAALASA